LTLKNKLDQPENCNINGLKEVIKNMPPGREFEKQAKIFKALSDITRLKIMYLLKDGELCVCEIMYALDKPQSTISHHLNILKGADLLKWRKEGIWNHYQLSDPHLIKILEDLKEKD
jgi:ArsR family transcriptional regulator